MSLLDSWTPGTHTATVDGAAVTHPTYRRGTGPGVIVIHEIPGLTPEVIGFGEEVVAAGYTVVMPHLFGTPEAPMAAGSLVRSLRAGLRERGVHQARHRRHLAGRRLAAQPRPRAARGAGRARASARSACASPAGSRSP